MSFPLRRPASATLWLLLWLLLGTVHVTQAIWTSGFADLPAGLGDGRFNHLVLEHGYQSWRGHYDWMSPGQFFPVRDTLGWSDTHAGTLPFYIGFRAVGFDPELAMQAWYLVCAALNVASAVFLLRRLGLTARWAPPVAVGAFAGLPMVWTTGTHPQLLPLFPTLWAAAHAVTWAHDRQAWRGLAVVGGLAWQFAAAPYLAFFAAFIGAVAGVVCLLLKPTADAAPSAAAPPRFVKFGHLFLAGAGVVAGAVNVRVYAHAVQSGVGRPMHELIDLAPRWSSWFAAPPGHWLYPAAWPAGDAAFGERLLLGGFLPWIGGLAALVVGLRRGASATARRAGVLAVTAWVTVLFFTSWPGEHSPWLWLGERIEPLRAFRAAGRIGGLVHALFFAASGLLLMLLWIGGRRTVAGISLALLLLETTAIRQPHYGVAEAQGRRDALVEAWEAAGDGPILAWAPGFTNQSMPAQNLDAWAAALAKHRVTLNGYSGGAPGSHQLFIWNPNEHTVGALLTQLDIPRDEVSIVTRLPAGTADRIGYEFRDARVLQPLEDFDLQPTAWDLLVPPERFVFEQIVFYQFTPNAKVEFRLPDAARRVTFQTGPRPGSWNNGGNSDGYALRWKVLATDGRVLEAHEEIVNPRDNPADRGFAPRRIELPAGTQRRLILETGPGPSGSNNWDWPLIGRLRVEH